MWKNWGGNQSNTSIVAQPKSLDELREIVSTENAPRIVGAGHSFTPLVSDASCIVSLQDLSETELQVTSGNRVWMNANKRLNQLSPELADHGLAFRNLGDINVQTLAGAVSTATHGTGEALQCLSAELRNAKILLSSGDIINTEDDSSGNMIEAARVSLGVLGVLLEAEVQLIPKYYLRRRVEMSMLQDTLEQMHDLWSAHRNFEFFYIPWSRKTLRLRHDLATGARNKAPKDLDNLAVYGLRFARLLGRLHPALRRQALALLSAVQSDEDYAGESWQVLCSQRDVRFVEMEYHLPPQAAQEVLMEVIERTESRHPDIYFPIEVRKTAGDTGWLSPFQGNARVSIAVHAAAGEKYATYFSDIEPIFRAAGGRPHWGKLHSLKFPELQSLFPDFHRFCDLRENLDPKGKFLSPSMRDLFVGGD